MERGVSQLPDYEVVWNGGALLPPRPSTEDIYAVPPIRYGDWVGLEASKTRECYKRMEAAGKLRRKRRRLLKGLGK